MTMMITVLLVMAAAPVSALSWSPQGDRLVYMNEGELFVVDAYSHQVTSIGPGSAPTWSPVGNRILFTLKSETRNTLTWETFIMQEDGSGRRRIGDGYSVGWSPSGERYAYWQLQNLPVKNSEYTELVPVIFIEDLDGKNRKEIILSYLDYDVTDWWSLGIVYRSVAGWAIRSSQHEFTTILDPDSDPYRRHRRLDGAECSPGSMSWSAATSRLAYHFRTQTYAFSNAELGMPDDWVPPQGLFVKELFGQPWEIGQGLGYTRSSWSPDGQRLAFSLEGQIVVASGDSLQQIRRLTFDSLLNSSPYWSPAGDQIAYFSRTDREDLRRVLKFVQVDTPTGIKPSSWGEIKRELSRRACCPE